MIKKLKDWISASLSTLPTMCLKCGNTDESKLKLLVENDEDKLFYSTIRCLSCGWRSDERVVQNLNEEEKKSEDRGNPTS